jgi:hypothetical protein
VLPEKAGVGFVPAKLDELFRFGLCRGEIRSERATQEPSQRKKVVSRHGIQLIIFSFLRREKIPRFGADLGVCPLDGKRKAHHANHVCARDSHPGRTIDTLAQKRLSSRGPQVRLWVGDGAAINARDAAYDAVFDFE